MASFKDWQKKKDDGQTKQSAAAELERQAAASAYAAAYAKEAADWQRSQPAAAASAAPSLVETARQMYAKEAQDWERSQPNVITRAQASAAAAGKATEAAQEPKGFAAWQKANRPTTYAAGQRNYLGTAGDWEDEVTGLYGILTKEYGKNKEDPDYLTKTGSQIDDLIRRGQSYATALANSGNREGTRYAEQLTDYLSGLRSAFDSEDAYEEWQLGNRLSKYDQLEQQPDYAANSRYQSTANGEGVKVSPSGQYKETGYGDLIYEAVNGNEDARNMLLARRDAQYGGYGLILGKDDLEINEMTPQEVSRYNYLYKTEGPEAAEQYRRDLTSELNYRERNTVQQRLADRALNGHAVGDSLATVFASPLKTLSLVGNITNLAAGNGIDQNAGTNRWSYGAGATRQAVGERVSEKAQEHADSIYNWITGGRAVLSSEAKQRIGESATMLYQTLMSRGDSLVNGIMTAGNKAVSLTLLGMEAAADTMTQLKDQGYDDTRTLILGLTAGGIEALTESMGFDKLFHADRLSSGVIKYMLSNILPEAAEEASSDVLNWVADAIYDVIAGTDDSQLKRELRELEAELGDHDAAVKKLISNMALEVATDALGGALGGLGGSAWLGAGDYVSFSRVGKSFTGTDNLNARNTLMEAARGSAEGTAANDVLRQLETKQAKGRTLSREDLGRLYFANELARQQEGDTAGVLAQAAVEMQMNGKLSPETRKMVAENPYVLQRLGVDTDLSERRQQNEINSALGNIVTEAERETTDRAMENIAETLNTRAREESRTNRPLTRAEFEREAARDLAQRRAAGETTQASGAENLAKSMGIGDRGATTYAQMEGASLPEFTAYWNAGHNGTALENVSTTYAGSMSPEQRIVAWNSGRMDSIKTEAAAQTAQASPLAQARAARAAANTKAGMDREAARAAGLTNREIRYIDALGKATGYTIEFVDKLTASNGRAANALISGNTIRIARDTEDPFGVAATHEVVHAIKDVDPEAYDLLASFVSKNLSASQMTAGVAFRTELYKGTDSDVTEELVADAFARMANDRQMLNSLASEHPNVLRRVIEAIQDLMTEVKRILTKDRKKLSAAQVQEFSSLQSKLREMNTVFTTALTNARETVKEAGQQAQAKENAAAESGGVKYALDGKQFTEDKYFARQMDRWDDLKDGTRVKVGTIKTGSALNQVGLPSAGMWFDVGKIRKAMNEHADHLTPDIFKSIPDLLNDPIVIAEYTGPKGNIKNTVNVYGNLFYRDKPVVVGVVMHLDASGQNVITNIRTVHARSDFAKQITDESVLYLNEDKKKARSWFQVCGNLNVPLNGTKYGLIRTIAFDRGEVKENSSLEKNARTADKAGITIDAATESASPNYSLKTWSESDYVTQKKLAAMALSEALGVSQKKATAYINAVNGIANIIAKDRERLDYTAAEGLTAFVGNSEYGGSIDFSTICKKRRLLTGTFTAIQKALGDTALTVDEILELRNMMKERGYEVSCGLCYVEGSRANMGQFSRQFINLYKKYNPAAAWIPTMDDVNTPDGVEEMRKNHPEVYSEYQKFWNNHGKLREGDKNLFASQQKPKLYQAATEYKGEVLQKFTKGSDVEEKNLNGGLRLQSFSDFEIIHLLDAMQVIMDMSRVGLAGQAYTKVPDFAWALGGTGLKINLSLIAKGVDENGHLILDEVEGMKRADAEALRNAYSKNVGTIVVVFNDQQLKAAMADDFIDFIIPFHRSQWARKHYEAMGLPGKVRDYTNQQNEKLIIQTYHEYQGRMVKDKATTIMSNTYWDFSKTGKENAEKYLQLCAESNRRPVFYKLLVNNGDGSYSLQPDGSTDGYWKLLTDFKMYDNNGKGAPQMPVRPTFNLEQARRMLDEYEGGHRNYPVAQDVVDDFVKQYNEKHGGQPGTKFSLKAPVEETKDLLAVHGMTEKNLRDALKLGGLPMPSIAIVKAASGHNKFGEISLLFSKDTIDPRASARNKVYGSDAWTPTAPRVDYEVNRKNAASLEKTIGDLSSRIAGGLFENNSILRQSGIDSETNLSADELAEKLANTDAVRAAYLADKGKTLVPRRREKVFDQRGNAFLQKIVDSVGAQELASMMSNIMERRMTDDQLEVIREIYRQDYKDTFPARLREKRGEEYVEQHSRERAAEMSDGKLENYVRHAWEYYEDGGKTKDEVDRIATSDALREAVNYDDVVAWIRSKLDGVLGEPGIYNGKDYYTPSGSRKSFRAIHDAYTLENIVKAMKTTQAQRGEGVWGVSAKGLQAVATPSYRSISEIKKDSSRLATADDYEEQVSRVEQELSEILGELGKTYFERDTAGTVLMEAAQGARTASAIRNFFARESDLRISEDMANRILKLYKDAAALPTEYFEAKPQRAVDFSEVMAAVVPEGFDSKLKQAMLDAGVQSVLEYEQNNDADRTAKLNSVEGARFSLKQMDAEYEEAVKQGEEWKQEKLVRDAAAQWGAVLQDENAKNPRPLDLYHGTRFFGFTEFDMDVGTDSNGMIYTSTKREVSANYAGRDHYAGVRPVGKGFIEGATKAKDIIQNAESVFQSKYHVMNSAEIAKRKAEIEKTATEISDRYMRLYDAMGKDGRNALYQWDEEDYKFTNDLSTALYLFDSLAAPDQFDSEEGFAQEVVWGVERFESSLQGAREYINEHRAEIKELPGGKDLISLVMGYDMFDAYVDISYIYTKLISGKKLIDNEYGSVEYPSVLQEKMEQIHNIGAYHLYGNLGNKPLVIDCKRRDWLSVEAPNIMGDDGYYSTDSIAKKARAEGYTGVVFKNVYDGGGMADDYVFFNANQVKSADLVTYDNKGKLIPLSERFNPRKNDIRYSIKGGEVYNRTAVLEESTVDKYLKDYASKSSPKYAQAYIAYMSPAEFLALTTSREGRAIITQQTGELDIEKLKDATVYQPFQLRIDHETGEVIGHEGRHRLTALMKAGVERVPVLLFDSSNKNSKTAMDSLTLTGQDFGHSRSYARVTVNNVQPLSYGNRQAVVDMVSRQPTNERIAENYGRQTVRYSISEESNLTDEQKRKLDAAVKMLDNGATREELYDSLGVFITPGGRIQDGIGGQFLGRYDNDTRGKGRIYENGESIEPGEIYGRADRGAVGEVVAGEAGTRLKKWEDLTKKRRDRITKSIAQKMLYSYGDGRMLYNAYASKEEFAKDFYSLLADGRSAAESWKKSIPDYDALVDEVENISGGRKYSLSDREQLDKWIEQYGAIPTGEKPTRDIPMPVRTEASKKLSQTVRTVLEARVTPDTEVPTIENLTTKGVYSYTPYADKAAIAHANGTIESKGWDEALADWRHDVRAGKVSKDNTAIGWALYNNAATAKDAKTAIDILNDIVIHQRHAAQAVQATRILKQLTPEAQLYAAAKSVQKLNEELQEKYGDDTHQVEISEDLAGAYLAAKDKAQRDEVMKEIYRNVGRQMPSSFMDRWNAWRYLAMLGNPRTHVRNIVGNAGFAPVVAAKDFTATAIESMVSLVSGGKIERTKGFLLGANGARLLKAAWDDYTNVQEEALGEGKYAEGVNANKYIQEGRRIFGNTRSKLWNKTGGAALEAARKGNSFALDIEDVWFSRPHYALAMAQFCAAHKISPQQIASGSGIRAAQMYAIREAQKATYRDTNAFSAAVSGLGRGPAWDKNVVTRGVRTLMEGVLPFRKTPANILARGVEYSPLGLMKSITVDLVKAGKGQIAAADMIDNLAAGLTGTALMALGAFLGSQGLVRGRGDDDEKKKKMEDLQGHQDYALELPNGTSVTIDWLAPECLPFFIGVNAYEAWEAGADGNLRIADLMTSIGNVTEPMLEMSCLQSLNNVFDTVGYAKDGEINPLTAALASAAWSYLTQAVPTLLGQSERTAEDRRQTTYTSKGGTLPTDIQYEIGKLSAKIPGWDYNQIPYIDAWGRNEMTGKAAVRATNNFINPAYMSRINETDVERELIRLYDATDESVFPQRADRYVTADGEKKYLTASEYMQYATEKGQTSLRLVSDLIKSDAYKKWGDAEKAEGIKAALEYAKATSAAHVGGTIAEDSWVRKAQDAEAKGISPSVYIPLYENQKGIESLKTADGTSIANTKGLQVMDLVNSVSGLKDDQRRYLYELWGAGKEIINKSPAAVKQQLEGINALLEAAPNGGKVELAEAVAAGDTAKQQKLTNLMLKSGLYTEKNLKKTVEDQMKKDAGVDSVKDLDTRYYADPETQKKYEGYKKTAERSPLWEAASDYDKGKSDELINGMISGSKQYEKQVEKAQGGASVGLTESDWVLYKLALYVQDQDEGESGSGSYTNAEVEAAIRSLQGLNDEQRRYLWTAQGKSAKSNPF